MEPVVYYTSDSPCRKCSSTVRYRNTMHKGACADCVRVAAEARIERAEIAPLCREIVEAAEAAEALLDPLQAERWAGR